ncbi:hypothetical protein [Streptomyces sp. B3I8]|uniref:hypothetical protein n=1 Tax=Streptomyces sp. B3I8 TaxID=3042303 RepID=UPI0027D8A449|nr:hypothetical protein [Streptomyces sp. B3I8]
MSLWDVGAPRAPVPQGVMAYLISISIAGTVAFSPTGHFLVTTISGSVDVWSTVPEDDEDQLCTAVGDVIDQEEWRRYVPHERYAPPCARSDPGRIHTVPAATP